MADNNSEFRATFTAMARATQEDWAAIAAGKKQFNKGLPNRVLAHLNLLEGQSWGFSVDRRTHCLQSATLAHRAGKDEEYVVCALLHDVGYSVGPRTHADIAAAILKPFVSQENHWMVANHDIFEGYYFLHHFGGNRNAREVFRGHPYFAHTAYFCEAFDQCAFDPAFAAMPLEAFAPMVQRILAKPRRRRLAASALESSMEVVSI